MEQLLASYLYQYKICPLPGVGTLQVQPGAAVAMQADQQIHPPFPVVEFSTRETDADGLLQYLSGILKIDTNAASLTLNNFCNSVLQLQGSDQLRFAGAGVFKADYNGRLYFESAEAKAAYLQVLNAERIIHPDAKHNMLVGDTHTNTGAMTEMLFAEEKPRRASWIWWAVGLVAAGALAIALYMANHSNTGFGRSTTITPANEPAATYSTGSK